MNEHTTNFNTKVKRCLPLSPVWLLPIFAALIAGWLLVQQLLNPSIEIKIHFDSASSILVDKTKIRYKGVVIGRVSKLKLNGSQGVSVVAEIQPEGEFLLKQSTQFYLVSPKASLTSISGLDTLFSGSYINVKEGLGETSTTFRATENVGTNIPADALVINLKTEQASSIQVGTPIFYKKIEVGKVANVHLDHSATNVLIKAYVVKKYKHLIKQKSKFWNISGLQANLSTKGLTLDIDSIISLIAGGITFSSDPKAVHATSSSEFILYKDIEEAKEGLLIKLLLDNVKNLPSGAGVIYKGHGIGLITDIKYSQQLKKFIATAKINPEFAEDINSNSQFVINKTSLSLSKISDLSNILTGDYIEFVPSKKKPDNTNANTNETLSFHVQETLKGKYSDLKLVLQSSDVTGIDVNDPISYKGIKIGSIKSISFSKKGEFINLNINIKEKAKHLITANSHFYLLNGISIKASFNGVKISSAPLENIISGGIGLYHPDLNKKRSSKKKQIKNHVIYHLYPSLDMAIIGKGSFTKPLKISLLSKKLPSISAGSPVYFHKLPIGAVTSFKLSDSGLMQTNISIDGQYKHLISQNSIFWNISGFTLNAGLSGVKIKADSLLAMASGGIAVDIGSKNLENKFKSGDYKLFDTFEEATKPAYSINVIFDRAYDLQVGSKIRFKGLVIGEVKDLSLTLDKKIDARLEINPTYSRDIARGGSKFWIEKASLSLTGSKNLSSIITGVFINVSTGKGNIKNHFIGETQAPVTSKMDKGSTIILISVQAGSTDLGSPVYHRQIKIGEVIQKSLSNDSSHVEIKLNIYPKYSHLIRKNSIFWPASGFNLDVGITGITLKSTSLNSLIKGGISMSTPDNRSLQPQALDFSKYELKTEMKEKWLKWKMIIPQPK